MSLFSRTRDRQFSVTVQFDGRHPYLDRPSAYCVPSFRVAVQVMAADWNDAVKQAMNYRPNVKFWSHYVLEVRN